MSDSLLQALEGAAEPSQPPAPAAAGAAPAHAEPPALLPVAVAPSDQRSAAAAVRASPAVGASLAVEQDAPEVAAAELAQPEALDATAEYLRERDAARAEEGLGEEEEVGGPGRLGADQGRIQVKVRGGEVGGGGGAGSGAPEHRACWSVLVILPCPLEQRSTGSAA